MPRLRCALAFLLAGDGLCQIPFTAYTIKVIHGLSDQGFHEFEFILNGN